MLSLKIFDTTFKKYNRIGEKLFTFNKTTENVKKMYTYGSK